MNKMYNSRQLQIAGVVLAAIVWLANGSNPPNGRTAAPFDGTCNSSTCHGSANSGGYNADITLDGISGTITPNTDYNLTITVTPTAGNPLEAGYQLVVVDGNNVNNGDLSLVVGNTQSGTEMFNGREYVEQRGGRLFNGNPLSWVFNWKSGPSAAGSTVKFYYIANLTNNNNNASGDFAVSGVQTFTFQGPPPVSASITNTVNPLCNGGNTGNATAEGAGGTPPYTYLWSNGQTSATAINLIAGNYTVTVTGAGGSGTATAVASLSQPTAVSLSTSAGTPITCINTSSTATATAGGGTGPYSYSWSNGDSGNVATFVAPGTYTVTTTDSNGCTKTATVSISGNITPPLAAASNTGNITCVQSTVNVLGTGSSTGGSFSYLWTTANGNIVAGANAINAVVNAPGTYQLQVTNNSNGCTQTATTTVSAVINPPGATATGGVISCQTPTTTINANSPTSGVNYAWTGPGFSSTLQNPTVSSIGTYTVTVTNPANGCTSSATTTVTGSTTPPGATASAGPALTCTNTSTTVSVASSGSGLTFAWTGPGTFSSTQQTPTVNTGGIYTVTVTGSNGCTSTSTTTVSQNITPPTAGATGGTITCGNSSVTLVASTNASQPIYAWSGPGGSSTQQNYTVTVADTYTLVVTNAVNGCTASAVATVSSNTTPPVASATTPGNLNCTNTSLQLNGTASSQGANFSYQWSTTNGILVSGANTLAPVVGAPGVYCLTVTNTDNACTSTTCVTVLQTPALAATSTFSNVLCNGGATGSATVLPTGGNGVFTYSWNNGGTTAVINNLPAGVYIATVTDGEGCTTTSSVTIAQPDVLGVNASATGETANGANNGTATAAPTGGTGPYTYLWNNNATTATISSLPPASYTVTVADANACTAVQSVTVNSFNCALTATISSTNITCNGAANGTAATNLSGAVNPVTYLWSNNATTSAVSNLAPGAYTVQITDANGCPASLNVSITEPPSLNANATATGETAANAANGTAAAQPSGGVGPYTYLWNNSSTSSTISNLTPGIYTVIITDFNNCTVAQSVTVSAFNCAVTPQLTQVNVACFGGNTGSATALLNGGTLPITYLWSNSSTSNSITNLSVGTYTCAMTDASGCVGVVTATITQPSALTSTVASTNVLCPGDQTGSAIVTANGGVGPYQYTWPNGGAGGNLGVGTYTVTITDANGCTLLQNVVIVSTDNQPPSITCPGNIVLCGADIINYSAPTLQDNCSLGNIQVVLLSGQASGTAFNDGVTTQVFSVTDASGNSATCAFTVTIFPIPDIGVNGITNDMNSAGTGSIAVSPLGNTGPYVYVWRKNGEFFSNEEDITGLSSGIYTLVVTDANGCTGILAPITIDNIVGANEPERAIVLRVIPNPVSSSLRLEIEGIDAQSAQIMDISGRQIMEIAAADLQSSIDVYALSAGMYYIRVQSETGAWKMVKWVKQD